MLTMGFRLARKFKSTALCPGTSFAREPIDRCKGDHGRCRSAVYDPPQGSQALYYLTHCSIPYTMTGFSRFEVLAWAATVMLKRHNDDNPDAMTTGLSQSMETTKDDETEDETEEETEKDSEDDEESEYDDAEESEEEDAQDESKVEKDSDGNVPYWMRNDWTPTNSTTGKQKSPKQIRVELQRYLQTTLRTKTSILLDMGVNSNSFRKFMDADNYKDPWRASTYYR
jgi:hypothetical protein